MTTAAERWPVGRPARSQRGQSIVEFAFLVPLVFLMVTTLRQVNMAINAAIVNTKYARNTMMFLFFNHRYYPEDPLAQLQSSIMQRWWVGVSNELVTTENQDEAGEFVSPPAPTVKVGQQADPADKNGDSGADTASATGRQFVRIRATAFVCLPTRGLRNPQYSLGSMNETTFGPNTKEAAFCSSGF